MAGNRPEQRKRNVLIKADVADVDGLGEDDERPRLEDYGLEHLTTG